MRHCVDIAADWQRALTFVDPMSEPVCSLYMLKSLSICDAAGISLHAARKSVDSSLCSYAAWVCACSLGSLTRVLQSTMLSAATEHCSRASAMLHLVVAASH